jgi:acyl carrier protein
MQDVRIAVRRFILENFIVDPKVADFSDGDSFLERRMIDSTGFIELIAFLEETWGVTVADAEMVPENLDTIDGIAAYLERKRAG